MQKLKFINAKGIEIDLTDGDYGITEWNGFSNVDLNLQTQQVPFNDGSVYLDGLLAEREISVTLAIRDNNDLKKRYRLRRELISVLNPKLGEGTLIYTNNYISKQIKAVPQVPTFETHNSNDSGTPKAGLAWTCPSPYWEDLEETEITLSPMQSVEINYEGDIETQPTVQFLGSADDVTVRNIDNKTKLSFDGNVADAVADLGFGKKTFNKEELGFSVQGMQYFDFAENEDKQLLYGFVINETEDFENFDTVVSTAEDINAGSFGNGWFVYGGTSLKKSQDGKNWINITSKPTGSVDIIYYDKETSSFFMYIGGYVYQTYDLETFTNINYPINYTVLNIKRHGNYIFFVGTLGTCARYDGTNFTEITTGFDNKSIYAIESDGTNVIIAGDSGIFKYSSNNGDTWSNVTTTNSNTSRISSICYNPVTSMLFACGYDGYVGKGSVKSFTWQKMGENSLFECSVSKLFGFVEFVGLGILVYRNDEFERITEIPNDITCCAKFNGVYYAGGTEGHLYKSTNLKTWESIQVDFTTTHGITKVATIDGLITFYTEEGDFICSDNGINFTFLPVKQTDFSSIKGLVYLNDAYYAYAETHKVYKSTNRLDWVCIYDTESVEAIFALNNKLIIITQGYNVVVSDDGGDTFTTYSTPLSKRVYCMDYFEGYYLILTEDVLYKTNNFTEYTQVINVSDYKDPQAETSAFTAHANFPLIANNKFFVTVCNIKQEEHEGATSYTYYSQVLMSEDLVTFNVIPSLSCNNGYGVIGGYSDNKYYLTCYCIDYETMTEGYFTESYNSNFEKIAYLGAFLIDINADGDVFKLENIVGSSYYNFWVNDVLIAVVTDIPCYAHDLLSADTPLIGANDYFFDLHTGNLLVSPINYPTTAYGLKARNNKIFMYFYSRPTSLKLGSDLDGTNGIVFKINGLSIAFQEYEETAHFNVKAVYFGEKYVYAISEYFSFNQDRYVSILDANTFETIKTIRAEYSDGQEGVESDICIGLGNYVVWAETNYLFIANVELGSLVKIAKNFTVNDFAIKNNAIFAIGYGGMLYTYDMESIIETYNARFTFRQFVRNDEEYFVGLYSIVGSLKYFIKDNIINQVKNFSLKLSVGINNLVLSYDNGNMVAIVKYRQKYIGV